MVLYAIDLFPMKDEGDNKKKRREKQPASKVSLLTYSY